VTTGAEGAGEAAGEAAAPSAGAVALLVWAKAEIIVTEIIEKTAIARKDRTSLLVIR
jgi:hypothetical protein